MLLNVSHKRISHAIYADDEKMDCVKRMPGYVTNHNLNSYTCLSNARTVFLDSKPYNASCKNTAMTENPVSPNQQHAFGKLNTAPFLTPDDSSRRSNSFLTNTCTDVDKSYKNQVDHSVKPKINSNVFKNHETFVSTVSCIPQIFPTLQSTNTTLKPSFGTPLEGFHVPTILNTTSFSKAVPNAKVTGIFSTTETSPIKNCPKWRELNCPSVAEFESNRQDATINLKTCLTGDYGTNDLDIASKNQCYSQLPVKSVTHKQRLLRRLQNLKLCNQLKQDELNRAHEQLRGMHEEERVRDRLRKEIVENELQHEKEEATRRKTLYPRSHWRPVMCEPFLSKSSKRPS